MPIRCNIYSVLENEMLCFNCFNTRLFSLLSKLNFWSSFLKSSCFGIKGPFLSSSFGLIWSDHSSMLSNSIKSLNTKPNCTAYVFSTISMEVLTFLPFKTLFIKKNYLISKIEILLTFFWLHRYMCAILEFQPDIVTQPYIWLGHRG